jgi:hypothetical protein
VSTVTRLAEVIHDHVCSSGDRCGRYSKPESAHKDFYELRAQNIVAELEPVIGEGNVIGVVQAVLKELDL